MIPTLRLLFTHSILLFKVFCQVLEPEVLSYRIDYFRYSVVFTVTVIMAHKE